MEFKLAAKLVASRRYALSVEGNLNIGVVYAMWGEQNRLLPKNDTNPNGEDSLRTKIKQMEWVTADTLIDWTLYAVDDGCPYHSGKIAQEMANSHLNGEKVSVLFLSDAVPADNGPLKELKSADDSREAGAIILGCMQAISDGKDAVIYTDADSSVHLGQIGLLLRPFLDDNYRVVLGNRKDPDAVLVKEEGRWGIGIKLLRHMHGMHISTSPPIHDKPDSIGPPAVWRRTSLSGFCEHPTAESRPLTAACGSIRRPVPPRW